IRDGGPALRLAAAGSRGADRRAAGALAAGGGVGSSLGNFRRRRAARGAGLFRPGMERGGMAARLVGGGGLTGRLAQGGKGTVQRDILMLAWEYPPKVVGGLARHAAYLSRELARAGHRVVVLTQEAPGEPAYAVESGVEVHRLHVCGPPARDFVGWVKRLNFEMVERALQLFARGRRFDIIHAHDWLAAYAGKTLKHGFGPPLV